MAAVVGATLTAAAVVPTASATVPAPSSSPAATVPLPDDDPFYDVPPRLEWKGDGTVLPLLSYRTPEDGLATFCAPSYLLRDGAVVSGPSAGQTQFDREQVAAAVRRGWTVMVPDYEGPKSELRISGIVEGGVPADLDASLRAFSGQVYSGWIPFGFAALRNAYPHADVYRYLNPAARAYADAVAHGCAGVPVPRHHRCHRLPGQAIRAPPPVTVTV